MPFGQDVFKGKARADANRILQVENPVGHIAHLIGQIRRVPRDAESINVTRRIVNIRRIDIVLKTGSIASIGTIESPHVVLGHLIGQIRRDGREVLVNIRSLQKALDVDGLRYEDMMLMKLEESIAYHGSSTRVLAMKSALIVEIRHSRDRKSQDIDLVIPVVQWSKLVRNNHIPVGQRC